MTILFALSLLLQVAAPPPAAAPPPVPTDLSQLDALPWRAAPRVTPDLAAYVAGEVKAGRCAIGRPQGNATELEVELAVLKRADGTVRAVVPRAIGCPTVEQFAAGLVTSMSRGNLREAPEGWYRATLTFALNP